MFYANVKHANSYIRNGLFHKYCTSFSRQPDGFQCLEIVCSSFTLHGEKQVSWTTHCVLLPHLVGCMDIELWFSRRCIRFLMMAMKSDNVVLRTIINMGIEGFHSVMGRNIRLIQARFKMEESNVLKFWNHKCDNESDAVRLSVQVRELCG